MTTRSVHISPDVEDYEAGDNPRAATGTKGSFAASLWATLPQEDKARFNRSRLVQLVAGVWVATVAGTQFSFGIISNHIKTEYGFNQNSMTSITTAGNVFNSFTFPGGVLYDWAGPRWTLLSSMCLTGFGWIFFALIFKGIVTPSTATLVVANGLSNWGCGFMDVGSLMTNLFNFPLNRGEIIIIQKTFFGLGGTFVALVFNGFFFPDNYMGYIIFIIAFVFISVGFGVSMTRLPGYKRTVMAKKKLSKLPVEVVARDRALEQNAFANFHNPRLNDRRRLNYGVTCLWVTLIYFSVLSIVNCYVHIPKDTTTVLSILAILCVVSFAGMLFPVQEFPAFFDYKFLPAIHPKEETEEPACTIADALTSPKNSSITNNNNKLGGVNNINNSLTKKSGGKNISNFEEKNKEVAADLRGRDHSSSPHLVTFSPTSNSDNDNNNDNTTTKVPSPYPSNSMNAEAQHLLSTIVCDADLGQSLIAAAGLRTSFAHSARVAGGSILQVPTAVDPIVLPSVETSFMTNVCRPPLWCLWFVLFAITGGHFIIVNNCSEIFVAKNGGRHEASKVNLLVAMLGVGSSIGRVLIGYLESVVHKWNAEKREQQLEYLFLLSTGAATVDTKPVDMSPVYYSLYSSASALLPLCPLLMVLACVLVIVLPPEALVIPFILGAASQGMCVALIALTVREVYTVDVAQHYNFIYSSGMLSSLLLNKYMFGGWYDAESHLAGSGGNNNENDNNNNYNNITTSSPSSNNNNYVCDGVSCIQNSMIVLACINVVAVATAVYAVRWWLQVRRHFNNNNKDKDKATSEAGDSEVGTVQGDQQ